MPTNRNRILRWFVTYPKCELTKEDFSGKLSSKFDIRYLKTAQESHKDGTLHLHTLVCFDHGQTKSKLLKFFKSCFPSNWKRIHLKPVRNLKATDKYLDKEDTQPFVLGDLPTPSRRRSPREMYDDGDLTPWEFWSRLVLPFYKMDLDFAGLNHVSHSFFKSCFPEVPLADYPFLWTQEEFSKIEFQNVKISASKS